MQEKNKLCIQNYREEEKPLEEQPSQFINITDKDAGKSRDCLCSDEV